MSWSTDCCGRVPFASLIAAVLCWVGVVIYCLMTYQAVDASAEQTRRWLGADLPWLERVGPTLVVVAVVMVLFSAALLVVGALATGATRARVYAGWKSRVGGRVSCAVFLVLSYALTLCWLAVLSASAVVVFVYLVFGDLCVAVGGFDDQHCLNFTVLEPVLSGDKALVQQVSSESLVVCGARLKSFCALTQTASTWYIVAYVACVVVVLALVHFLVCLAANYAHIKDSSKYLELQTIWQSEENEFNQMLAAHPVNYRSSAAKY